MKPFHEAILEHPFVTGLTDATLPREAFAFYVIQDAHFLREFARALGIAAARARTEADIVMLSEHAAGTLEAERSLHEEFFADLGLDGGTVAATPVAPTNLAYTSYMLAVANVGSFAEAVAAVLPCYWIYWEVGKHLLKHGSPNPLYGRWIQTYGGEQYSAVVEAVLTVVDRLDLEIGPDDRGRMKRHVAASSRYEWMFWDMAIRLEEWPLAID